MSVQDFITPQGDGNSPPPSKRRVAERVQDFITPQGDGNKTSTIKTLLCFCSGLHYPARGRKLSYTTNIIMISSRFRTSLPRKGTETLLVVVFFNHGFGSGLHYPARGRKLFSTSICAFRSFACSGLHYPARGRKHAQRLVLQKLTGSGLHYPARGRKPAGVVFHTITSNVQDFITPQGDGNSAGSEPQS